MTPWGVDASTNVMAGFESLSTFKTVVDLTKAVQASLFCKKRGVSSDFLATQQHYKRGKTETREAVQRAWSAGGSRSSPGAESETVP